MGLTYHFKFQASALETSGSLEKFLKRVEKKAQELGFAPTAVLNVQFDSPDRQDFARRLTTGLFLEDERLQGVAGLGGGQAWHHDVVDGSCHVIPLCGVFLVVTDERRNELVLGFLKYPAILKDLNGRDLLVTGAQDGWSFEEFLKSPDARLRQLVKMFADAGYVEFEHDDFAATTK